MTVKAIRHHQSFAGRDADDAHAQYLSLTVETVQEMSGNIDLNHHRLEVSMIIGDRRQPLVIRPCDECGADMYLRGGQGIPGRKGSDIYLQTIWNCAVCGSGDIYIETYLGGSIRICADDCLLLVSDSDICVCATNINVITDIFCIFAEEFLVEAVEGICFSSPNGTIVLSADEVYFDADEIIVDGALESWGSARFIGLQICDAGDCSLGTLLKLNNTCDQADGPTDSCVPMIEFCGCSCDTYGQCAPLWHGASTGRNQAKYCLDGGIFINVNGCHRYIKFHRPLP